MEQQDRRRILAQIIDLIMQGKYDSSSVPLEQLTQLHTSVRQEYIPPYDRDSYNYGYTDTPQMNSSEQPF